MIGAFKIFCFTVIIIIIWNKFCHFIEFQLILKHEKRPNTLPNSATARKCPMFASE
jgi:hypothetical protein